VPKLKVAVVGGGIGGLTAALALRRAGLDVAVYEQASALGEIGAGITVQPNGVRVLDRLGLAPRLAEVGADLARSATYYADGTLVAEEASTGLGLHRADLMAILLERLPAEVLHLGKRCVAFDQDHDHASVRFADGTVARADVVVAADGIHSVLQQHVTDRAEPLFSGLMAYRGLVPADRFPDWPAGQVKTWYGHDRSIRFYPVRAGELINCVAAVPADEQMRESWSATGDPHALRAEFGDGWDPAVHNMLAQVGTTFRWGLYDREPLLRWSDGRLTLLGDAAHPMLPHLGQGANQAMEDALALAALLRDVDPGQVPPALYRYQILRLHRTARFQQLARLNAAPLSRNATGQRHRAANLRQSWVYDYDVEAEAAALTARI
jgi:salicylate hydroxylase